MREFQNSSIDANIHANSVRTHDQCAAISTATLTATNDVDLRRLSHKRAVPGKVLDPTRPARCWPEAQSRNCSTI